MYKQILLSCKCKLSDRFNPPYATSCKVINNNDIVVDVGCGNCRGMYDIKKHLKTHDIKITAIGIDLFKSKETNNWMLASKESIERRGGMDFLRKRDIEWSNSMDRFICKPVVKVNLEKVDIILCFGFACLGDRKRSYTKMVGFLKPGGKAVYGVYKEFRNGNNINKTTCVKLMTKPEAVDHAKTCITNDIHQDGIDCNHGIIIGEEEL